MAEAPPRTYLVADVGGTNLRLALARGGALVDSRAYRTSEHPTLLSAIRDFVAGRAVAAACLAVAGPVRQGHVQLTNEHATLDYDAAAFAGALGCPVSFLNDFEALGYYLLRPTLPVEELSASGRQEGPLLYVGAGTGLGVGFIAGGRVFASEGGHAAFAPQSRYDFEFQEYVRAELGLARVSVERVVSGQGLRLLCGFEARRLGFRDPQCPAGDANEYISRQAAGGQEFYAAVLRQFFLYYGRAVGDYALAFLPRRVYIAGGILNRNWDFFARVRPAFLAEVYAKGRVSEAIADIGVSVLRDGSEALHGCLGYLLQ